ncbi:unnamed protein product [Rhizophagus irregularis]|nr:unnamed protein product [Rhizophagus irregularis]
MEAIYTRFIQYTSEPKKSDQNLQKINQLTYFIPDKLCEQKAKTIIQEKQIINVEYTKDSLLLWIKSKEAFNSLDKKQTQELLLFEQELQKVYTGDLEDSISSNSTITDNIISIDKDSPTETIIPSTAVDTTIPLTETTTSTETTTPLTPLNLNTKHSISIWKQKYISSISNLLADLNDLITVENSMNSK